MIPQPHPVVKAMRMSSAPTTLLRSCAGRGCAGASAAGPDGRAQVQRHRRSRIPGGRAIGRAVVCAAGRVSGSGTGPIRERTGPLRPSVHGPSPQSPTLSRRQWTDLSTATQIRPFRARMPCCRRVSQGGVSRASDPFLTRCRRLGLRFPHRTGVRMSVGFSRQFSRRLVVGLLVWGAGGLGRDVRPDVSEGDVSWCVGSVTPFR